MNRKPHHCVAVFLLLSLILATAAGTGANEPYRDLTRHTAEYAGPGRDDAEAGFLVEYMEKGILDRNPFATIDRDGVGQLMEIAVEKGRAARSDLEVGICGEHGGDPNSVEFCHLTNLNYVSCSPFRVPIARLAAAHAALRHG